MKNNFFDFLESRGFIHQSTDKESIKKLFKDEICTGYIGFDCTADSLHVGSLLPLMILRNFQKFGHKPIILVGGGTTLIGDPSGKDETRKILTKEEIDNNKRKLRIIFEKFVSFDENQVNCAVIVDNYDWLMQLKLIPFLREVGSKFSVNKMINLESSKIRLEREQHLSFLEFNYSVLQAYDFVELFKKFRCKIQFGGSDQWGNIISGIELAKKMVNTTLFGVTTPLITTSTGQKMGKTANGAIWLSKDKLKITDFWQFWRNTSDSDVFQFLNYFTDLNSKDINELKNSKKDINELKIILANEVTKICHSEKDSKNAEKEAKILLTEGNVDLSTIENCEKKISIDGKTITKSYYLKEALMKLQLSSSNGESKRLISQGAVKLNEKVITNKEELIKADMFKLVSQENNKKFLIIYVGKKKYGVIELVS